MAEFAPSAPKPAPQADHGIDRAAGSSSIRGGVRDGLVLCGVLAGSALFLFIDIRSLPIILWDESRNIVNALEMKRAGFSLVTTYGGMPDLWNTKPPLLIWLMTASASLFGTSETALRLPSMLATLATLAVLMAVVRRYTKSTATAALSAVMLVASPCWFGEHSGRMADYDALLVFLTTSYLVLLLACLHRTRPRPRMMLAAGLAIAGAVLTKSMAGLIPGVGVVCYQILAGRPARIWQGWATMMMAVAALVPVLAFFAAREAIAPGYLLAALHNDAFGRFGTTVTGMERPPGYYLGLLWAGYFSVTPLLLLAPLMGRYLAGRTRLLLVFSLVIVAAQLAVISVAGTKLNHYIAPAMPFMAIAAAITVRALVGMVPPLLRSRRSGAKLTAALAVLIIIWPMAVGAQSAVTRRFIWPERYEGWQSGRYGKLIAAMAGQGITAITVVEPGFANDGDPNYAPVLRAYLLIWATRGVRVDRRIDVPGSINRGALMASCNPDIVALLAKHGPDFGGVPGCAAVRF